MDHKAEKPSLCGNGRSATSVSGHRRNLGISTFLAICFLVTLVSPFFSYIGRGFRTTWPLFVIWLLVFVCENHFSIATYSAILKKWRFPLLMLAMWFFVVLSNALIYRGYTGWVHTMLTVTFCMLIFMNTVYISQKPKTFWIIAFWVILLLGVEAMRSLPILFLNPGLPRELMEAPEVDLQFKAFSTGVGDFNLYTANAIMFPFFWAAACNFKGLKRGALFLSCIFIALAILLSTFTGAVLLMTLGILALFVLSYAHSPTIRMAICLIAVLAIFIFIFIVNISSDVAQIDRVISKSIRLFEGVSEYGFLTGDETMRAYLFTLSLNTFLDAPLLGIGPSTLADNPNLYTLIGGHSSWIDQLAEYGILGFGTFIAAAIAFALRATRQLFKYRNNLVIKAAFVTGILYFIGGIVNPVLFIPSIMALFYYLVLGSIEIEVNNAIIQQ